MYPSCAVLSWNWIHERLCNIRYNTRVEENGKIWKTSVTTLGVKLDLFHVTWNFTVSDRLISSTFWIDSEVLSCTKSHWNSPRHSAIDKAFVEDNKCFYHIYKHIIFFQSKLFQSFVKLLKKILTSYLYRCSFKPRNKPGENITGKNSIQWFAILLHGPILRFPFRYT